MDAKKVLESTGLVPVLRAGSAKEGHALVKAMLAGGVNIIEVTMTVPGAVDLLRELKSEYGDKVLLGSGTVTDTEQAKATIEAGAEFVISPSLHLDVIAVTKEMGKVSIPGALTPTEVITAWRAGADYVKVFPCSAAGGPGYLKALLAPFPELQLIPTGGITLANAVEYLNAGARALGVGSDLVNARAIAEGKPEIVTNAARAYLEIIRSFRLR
jgi:2-dehydro-3-deoxyphosphogluconate aldolase / (4S)-4-hydroxy-2-oxoglutarate aldolase